MPTNKYFNNFPAQKTNEQLLYEDLLVESIQIYGHDIYYLPRERANTTDPIFGENPQSYFERAYIIDMYIENIDAWIGGSDFFSKFGWGQNDKSAFIVAKRTFERIVPANVMLTPRAGDLLYVPVMQKIFEITFVEEEKLFFSKGNRQPYVYELKVEAFRSANEKLATGVFEIDQIDDTTSWTIQLTLSAIQSGDYHLGERVFQGANLAYSTASAKVSDWDRANNKIYLTEIIGQFEPADYLRGNTSNTNKLITTSDTSGDHVYYDYFNNKDIRAGANTIIDRTEINPFGGV
jgi:hypothetical protein